MYKRIAWTFLHVFVWLTVYLLPYFITYGEDTLSNLINEPRGSVHAISTALLIAYAYLNHSLLVPRLYLRRNYLAYAGLVIACVLVVIWFPQIFQSFEEHGPLALPPHGPGPHHEDHPAAGISMLSYNIILFVICTFASISIRQQRQLLETQKEKLDAELSFLKAQINPHFLFNTLNSIYALAIRKSDDTPKAITQLSELMRYILKDSDAGTVPLERELSYINNYVALQNRRLGHTVQIEYSAPAGVANRRVAPLILMSFVENAFKHGVNPSEDSVIHISISLNDQQLHLSVRNNKVTSVNQGETMGIGLKNATSRLERLYPGRHTLEIENGAKTFSVNLILQLDD